jgi:hypothetical protein
MTDPVNSKTHQTIGAAYIADHFTAINTERTFNIINDAEARAELSMGLKNVIADKAQGNLFEQLEVLKFNQDALTKDSSLVAKTTASQGMPHDPVDIIIKKGHSTLREIQVKSCNSAARSGFALSDSKYAEMARLAPKDQTARLEELLKKRIATGTLKASDYEQTLRNLQRGGLEHGNVTSGGTTYDEALSATDPEVAKVLASKAKIKSVVDDTRMSAERGGKIGATVAAGISLASGIYRYTQGEIEIAEVIAQVGVDAAKGYATGYAVSALSKTFTHTGRYLLGEAAAKSIAKSSAPVAIAAGIVTLGKSLIDYLKGDIDSATLLDSVNHCAITSTSSFYYGMLGQVAIPIPVVGALVGAGVGYLVGNLLHQSGLLALGDSQVVKAAKKRRRVVEALCLSVLPLMQQNRLEMERLTTEHFTNRKQDFLISLDFLDDSLTSFNSEETIAALQGIHTQFGIALKLKSFKEFDGFMKSDEDFDF